MPRAQPVQRRCLRRVRRPVAPRRRDPDAHPRRSGRRARARGRRSASSAVVMAGFVQRPIAAAAAVDPQLAQYAVWTRHLRPRQRVRLRPGLAEVPRARRRAGVPLVGHGLAEPGVDLELRVQPRRDARREPPRAGQVAVPRWRHPPLPRPQLRVPRGRRGLGRVALRRPRRPLGEAQRSRPCAASTPPMSTGTSSPSCSPATAASAASMAPKPTTYPEQDVDLLDEFAAVGIEQAEDIRELFVGAVLLRVRGRRPADGRPRSTRRPTRSARGFNAMFGSDISHWDVPEMADVLGEAYEMVEHDLFTDADLRDFVFTNPVRFYTRRQPRLLRRHRRGGRRRRLPRPARTAVGRRM